MGLTATFILYLVIGAGVTAAVLLREPAGAPTQFWLALSALLFWPIYVPGLLTPVQAPTEPDEPRSTDELSAAITRVESELDQALQSLDGWAESTLAAERSRLDELRQTWRLQAGRIRELDQLLEDPAIETELALAESPAAIETSRTAHTERSRRDNIARLKRIRRQLHEDLLASLAWVRELVTMIHLARYTGAPASRAEELVAQIAAAVEGLSAVSAWDAGDANVA